MSLNRDIPIGVLNAVRDAHRVSGSFNAQSLLSVQIIFFKMFLMSLLLTSTWPFAWG